METKFAKVLDNGRRVTVDLKRNRTAHCNMYITGAAPKLLSKRTASNSLINKVVKRRKLDGCNDKYGGRASQFETSLLKYYSNFTKSGIPQRVMFYQNGEWNDFPCDLIALIRKDLQVKKAAMDVEYNGHSFVLDFLHMVRLDLKTGFAQPMAWIDELGKCFFPETFSDDGEHGECCFRDLEGGQEDLFSRSACQDIRLQLEIEVKESDHSKFMECSGDSDAVVKKVRVNEKFGSGGCDLKVEERSGKPSDIGESKQIEENGIPIIEHRELDLDGVRKLFFMGIGSSVSADIVDMYRNLSSLMQARLELFYKQVEITNKYRGSANVRYAWFPTTKEELSSIMSYGLGHIKTSEVKCTYGVGVHLSPANCPFNSASCDIDENGVRHMVFCRVIMGNMEVVNEGSKQFHPSGEDFDSGVDDIQNPSHFIVWNMNKNTHIYPEYVVSFKVSSDAAGFVANNARKLDSSGVTTCFPEPPPSHLHFDKSCSQLVPVEIVQENVPSLGSSTARIPQSPWVAFPTLLAAVSDKIPPEYMKLLASEYELLRSKKISRQDFIRKLRLAIGDTLLRSIITDLHSKGGNGSGRLAENVEFVANKVMPKFGSNPIP